MVGIPVNCALQETYSALLEIEEHIITKKTDAWRWGPDTDSQSISETIYALAYLALLRGRLEGNVKVILTDLVIEAQTQLVNSRLFLKPFVLGHTALVHLKQESFEDATQILNQTLMKYVANAPLEYTIEILYSLSMFINILQNKENNNSNLFTELYNITKAILDEKFETLDPDSLTKLLYTISTFSKSEQDLKSFFDQHKHKILNLREQVSSPLIKAALLRPLSILEVECHKTIIEEAMEPIRNRKELGTFRTLRNRLSRFFLYGEKNQDGIELRINDDESTKLTIDLAPNELDNLREADYSIEYASTIGVCLITAGYSQVFIVPPLEERQYLEFLKSDSTEHIHVRKRSLTRIIEDQISTKMKIADIAAALGPILIIFIGLVLFRILGFLQSIESSAVSDSILSFIVFLFIQVVLRIYTDRSKRMPLDWHQRIFKRRELKNAIREEIISTLDVSDGWDKGFDYK